MQKSYEHITAALEAGYQIDIATGQIIGLKGFPLVQTGKRYYVVNCVLSQHPRVVKTILVHKFLAYCIFGSRAFEHGIHVRHLDGDNKNNRRSNLALGTASENEKDKPSAVRQRVAKIARQSQGYRAKNAKLEDRDVETIRAFILSNLNRNGRVKRGTYLKLSQHFSLSKSAFHQIGRQITYRGINDRSVGSSE